MKTDLQKIIAVSGQPGLFKYVAQAKAGVVVESLTDKRRMVCNLNTKLSSLSDISIYTESDEIKLQDLFLKMKEKLVDDNAPASKADAAVLKSFFEEVLPGYDRDRFYHSHMKKVVEWYNTLKENASLEFEEQD